MESWSLGGWMSLPCTPQPPGHHQLVSPSQPNTRGYQNFTCKAEGQRCARHPVTKHPLCSRDRHGVISLQLAGQGRREGGRTGAWPPWAPNFHYKFKFWLNFYRNLYGWPPLTMKKTTSWLRPCLPMQKVPFTQPNSHYHVTDWWCIEN